MFCPVTEDDTRKLTLLAVVVAIAISAACTKPTGTLEAAEDTLGAATVKSIEYSGTGKWFQFGQAPNPTLPWPPFDVSSFKAAINYEIPSARIEMVRKQTLEPPRVRPAPAEARPIQVVSGTYAWDLAPATWRGARGSARRECAACGGRGTDDGNLDVRQIAAIHGPRVATMADLRAAIGQKGSAN